MEKMVAKKKVFYSKSKLNQKDSRIEKGFVIKKENLNKFVSHLLKIASLDNTKKYNQTIYFNNKEHEVPFKLSIRARKYSNTPDVGDISLLSKWVFETKENYVKNGVKTSYKKREKLSLKEIIKKINSQKIEHYKFENALYPCLMSVNKREHYLINNNPKFRVTIDTDMKYFVFKENLEYVKIGSEPYVRVEIKYPKTVEKLKEIKIIYDLLETCDYKLIVSKKDMAYHYFRSYLSKKYNRKKPKTNTEIEAKFVFTENNQNIIQNIKKDITNGEIKGFKLWTRYPFFAEGAAIHRYVFKKDSNKMHRITLKGLNQKLVVKSNSEILKDKYGLNCILKRKEVEKKFDPSLLQLPYKILKREKKHFVIKNSVGTKYHISIDRTLIYETIKENKELYQLEIERISYNPSEKELKKTIEDIGFISNFVVKKYPFLKPTPLTKIEWANE